MVEILTIDIPLIPPSLNKWYAGTHWTHRKRVADLWHEAVLYFCKEHGIAKLKQKCYPITIQTIVHFKDKRRRDAVNYITANKLAEDGLVRAGVLAGDCHLYVGAHNVTLHYGQTSGLTTLKLLKCRA